MLKKIIIFSAGILYLILSNCTYAAMPKSSGAYVEGNVGVRNDQKVAFIANGGYKFNKNFAVEGGLNLLGKTYFDAAAKVIMPFNNGFDIFGKAGITNTIDFYGAVGIGYNFTPNVAVTAQGILITDKENKYAGTLGLTYMF
jgi:hypothetical protein